MHADEFPDLDRTPRHLAGRRGVAHLGYVKASKGFDTAGFRALRRLLAAGRAWVKLIGPYRMSATAMPHGDTDVFADTLAATAIFDRLVWGTDRPHVMAKWTSPMPNDGELTDLLLRWMPTKQRGGASWSTTPRAALWLFRTDLTAWQCDSAPRKPPAESPARCADSVRNTGSAVAAAGPSFGFARQAGNPPAAELGGVGQAVSFRPASVT